MLQQNITKRKIKKKKSIFLRDTGFLSEIQVPEIH